MTQPSLRLIGASFAYAGDHQVLQDASLHLTPGWTGLVGANGAGKTTLLKILSGELAPHLGHRTPPDLSVMRVDQRVDEPDDPTIAFSQAWDPLAVRLQSRLRLGLNDLDRWPTLSPGERRRWQVGAALWRQPAALLLDEPDNHLDAVARKTLIGSLRTYRGIGLIISHDRTLLDALTTSTLRLHHARLDHIAAPWSQAQSVWQERSASALSELQAASKARSAARRQLRAASETHAKASRSARTRRHLDPKDHDARSMGRKIAAASAERSHAKALSRSHTTAARAEAVVQALERPQGGGSDLFIDYQPPPKPRLLSLCAPVVYAGTQAVLRDVDVALNRGRKVWLSGANGSGKSTLIKALLNEASSRKAHLLVLPQELSTSQARALLDTLHALDPIRRGRVLQLVAALGVPPAAVLRTTAPSPGEARKLALALGLGTHAHGLILDEPTHHLDLPARQQLESALVHFPGAILMTTHDDRLAVTVCRHRWHLQEGRISVRSIQKTDETALSKDFKKRPK